MSVFQTLNTHEFHHVLEVQTGVSVVMFTSKGCGSCRVWTQLLTEYHNQHDITIFEVDAERDMALTNEFEVFHLPALFLYKGGQFHSPLQCEAQIVKLENAINDCLLADAVDMP
ncbi:MAG: thioredoxin family protein [Gammaproteobacteria bacterium]|nr:thioredoxin family protein [Gammaproteobacteria bacterium]